MSNTLALIIEGLVCTLLGLTIAYCHILNRRLERLRADEHALKATIAELVTATDIAERAISGLKTAVHDCDRTLVDRLRRAERISQDMGGQLRAGEDVLKRITQVAEAGKPMAAPEVSLDGNLTAGRAAATAAAAQAFASRARSRAAGAAA